jgi:hypothetical protein
MTNTKIFTQRCCCGFGGFGWLTTTNIKTTKTITKRMIENIIDKILKIKITIKNLITIIP